MADRDGSCLEPHLKRIRALSAQALRALCADGESLPSDARVERVTQDLHELLQYALSIKRSASVWSAIGGPHLAGLVALYGLAVRRSVQPNVPSAERDAYIALRSALAAHLDRLYTFFHPSVYNQVADVLAGTHSLRCYSAILAGLASELGAASASRSRHLGLRALGVLKETVALLQVLVPPGYTKTLINVENRLDELIDSRLLEHFSRVLLMASRCDGAAAEAAAVMKRLMPVLPSSLLSTRDGQLVTSCASLAYLLTSHVVGLAAALDGGRTYGMPAGPGAIVAPLFTTCGRPLRLHSADLADATMASRVLSAWERRLRSVVSVGLWRHAHDGADSLAEVCTRRLPVLDSRVAELNAIGYEELDDDLVDEFLYARKELWSVEEVLTNLQVPPFNVAATWDVSMRLADCAAEALAAAAAGEYPAQQQQLEEEQQHRPRMTSTQAADLGLRALLCARPALWSVGWAAEAVTPPLKRAQLERWWSLAARMIGLRSTVLTDRDITRGADLPGLLALRAEADKGPRSLEPSLDVTTALRAGYMRSAELLLRRPPSGDSRGRHVSINALAKLSRDSWAQVLSFAEPADVASLAASVAKSVRRGALRLSSALDTLRSELAASGVSEDVSEYTTRYVEGRDSSRQVQLVNAMGAALDEYFSSQNLTICAQQALNPVHNGPSFVHLLLENIGRSGASPVAVSLAEPAASEVIISPGREGRQQPGSSGADRVATQPGCSVSGAAGAEVRGLVCTTERLGAAPTADAAADADDDGAATGTAGCARYQRIHDDRQAVFQRLTLGLTQIVMRVLPEVTRLADMVSGYWFGRESNHDLSLSASMTAAALSYVPLLAAAAAAGSAAGGSQRNDRSTSGRLGSALSRAAGCTASAAAGAAQTPRTAPTQLVELADVAGPAAAWDRFLWSEVRLPDLLGLALRVVELQHTNDNLVNTSVEQAWVRTMWALLRLAPARLASVLREGSDQKGDEAGSSRSGYVRYPLSLPRARALLGQGGALPQPELLAALERVCAEDAGPTSLGLDCLLTEEELQAWVAAAALLPSPGEVLSVLPTCSNPLCTNLEGDSEADLKLSGCARCGGRVRYCSRECQVAHWKAGHKAECGRG